MRDAPLRIVLMGTGPFAVPSFDAICNSDDRVVMVVTRPEVANKSRKAINVSPVRQWALSLGLPIEAPASINEPAAIEWLRQLSADLFIVCDYGQILSDQTLATSRLGGINLHGSLLPAYRGAAPVQWAVWNGDPTSGVTTIHMTPRLDGGPVLTQAETPISPDETAGQLEQRLSGLGVSITLDAINRLRSWDGATPIGTPQNPALVSKAPRLSKSDGQIDWSQSNDAIRCQFNAVQPWPGAFVLVESGGKQALRFVLHEIESCAAPQVIGKAPGTVSIQDKRLVIATGDGAMQVIRLQPAGRREMSAIEFLNGNPLAEGVRVQLPECSRARR